MGYFIAGQAADDRVESNQHMCGECNTASFLENEYRHPIPYISTHPTCHSLIKCL